MAITMMYHPTCSKCKITREIFEGSGVEERNLVEAMLTKEEIMEIARTQGVNVQNLLRPNSPVYQERKDELFAMDEGDLAALMATEPGLIKRPIIKTEQGYLIGLNEEKFRELAGK